MVRRTVPRPRVPITIIEHFSSAAISAITSPGFPLNTALIFPVSCKQFTNRPDQHHLYHIYRYNIFNSIQLSERSNKGFKLNLWRSLRRRDISLSYATLPYSLTWWLGKTTHTHTHYTCTWQMSRQTNCILVSFTSPHTAYTKLPIWLAWCYQLLTVYTYTDRKWQLKHSSSSKVHVDKSKQTAACALQIG